MQSTHCGVPSSYYHTEEHARRRNCREKNYQDFQPGCTYYLTKCWGNIKNMRCNFWGRRPKNDKLEFIDEFRFDSI